MTDPETITTLRKELLATLPDDQLDFLADTKWIPIRIPDGSTVDYAAAVAICDAAVVEREARTSRRGAAAGG